MTTNPWSRDLSSPLPTELVRWTCTDCGHTGMIDQSRLERPAPQLFVTMGVSLKPPARPGRTGTYGVRKFTLCRQCDVDNMLLQGLPEMERMVVLRHVYRLGVITRRQLIEEQIKLYTDALDDPAYLRMPENKIIVSASRVRTLRVELAALGGADTQE